MKTFIRQLLASSIATLVLLNLPSSLAIAGPPGPAPAPPIKYQIAFRRSAATTYSMNKSGVAVGWETTASGTWAKVFGLDGTMTDLTGLAPTIDRDGYTWKSLERALAINANGQIAGHGWRIEDGVPRSRLFRYSPSPSPVENVLEVMRTVVGSTIWVKGINDSGDVVLHANTSGKGSTLPSQPDSSDSAWVFSGLAGYGAATQLLNSAVPGAINNLGQVTGAINANGQSAAFRTYGSGASLYDVFGTINGGTTSRYQKSEGHDINDFGIVVGWACRGKLKSNDDTSQKAVRLGTDGKWIDLGGSGANSWATAVNNNGVSVGWGAATGIGFVHIGGTMYSIRDLIVNSPTNLRSVNAYDISDNKDICGQINLTNADGTGYFEAVILRPVP